jgi:hypothetical protein
MLKAVDLHNELYFDSKNIWHLSKAEEIRRQIIELKNWINFKENN